MCIIVDANTFFPVFQVTNADHAHFSVIKRHIDLGYSRMIIGGTKFENELNRFYVLMAELKRSNQLVVADKKTVDLLEEEITKNVPSLDNDQHIVALSTVSRAKVVCTNDGNLQTHLRKPAFYNKGITRPSIFNSRSPATVIPPGPFKKPCLLCR